MIRKLLWLVTGFMLILSAGHSISAAAKSKAEISYVHIQGGDPAKPAILDPSGKYSSRYIKKAKKISPVKIGGKQWVSAIFPVRLHKESRICEERSGEVHPYGPGFLIIEYSSFFDAFARADSKQVCEGDFTKQRVSAASSDHYLLGKWAVRAIKEQVIGMAGRADDPLCVAHSMLRCPAIAERAARYDTIEYLQAGSCLLSEANCIVVTGRFEEKLTKVMTATVIFDIQVRYRKLTPTGEPELIDFTFVRSPPTAPRRPGVLPLVRTLPVKS